MRRSGQLGVQFGLFDGSLRLYTPEAAMLFMRAEEAERRAAQAGRQVG